MMVKCQSLRRVITEGECCARILSRKAARNLLICRRCEQGKRLMATVSMDPAEWRFAHEPERRTLSLRRPDPPEPLVRRSATRFEALARAILEADVEVENDLVGVSRILDRYNDLSPQGKAGMMRPGAFGAWIKALGLRTIHGRIYQGLRNRAVTSWPEAKQLAENILHRWV